MIAYEDLCVALDRYNRRLRGEVVPETPPPAPHAADDFDIMEEAEVEASPAAPEFGADFGPGTPDITAETELPEAGYDPQYQQQGYDPNAYAQQGYAPQYPPQGQPPIPGHGGYDPNRQ